MTTGGVDQSSAKAMIEETLRRYGLESLGSWAWSSWLSNIPIEQIFMDIRETPEYRTRFPAMKEMGLQGRAITEEQYISFEQGVRSVFKAAGIPEGFYDEPSDFTDFLLKDIALPEIQSRVDVARTAVFNSDPNTLQALEDFYGASGRPDNMMGDLTAYFLDDTRALPVIQQQFIAAQTAGAAATTGFGSLSRTDAERLARLGITQEKTIENFGTLASMKELFGLLPGEEALTAPTPETGIAALFEGSTPARQAIERKAGERTAQFKQSGGFQQSQKGISGVG